MVCRAVSVVAPPGARTIEVQVYAPPEPSPPRRLRGSPIPLTLMVNVVVPTPVAGC